MAVLGLVIFPVELNRQACPNEQARFLSFSL
jgi:hypothetical protein